HCAQLQARRSATLRSVGGRIQLGFVSLFVSPRAKGIARKWKPKRAETAPQHQRPYKSLQKWKETSKGSSPCGPTTFTQYRTDYQRGIFFGVIFVSYFVSFLLEKDLNCALNMTTSPIDIIAPALLIIASWALCVYVVIKFANPKAWKQY
ncbi:MAG: hypothetical protein KC476_11635, partial [Cyanobacteria bacterium HKST-UBA06]|nr:hypothetical protein [Cyanobacteria bacterium HKST-UBA06]